MMRDGNIVKALRLGAVAAVLLAAASLQARSCKELCEKFGSYEACESLKAGKSECPAISAAPANAAAAGASSPGHSEKEGAVLYTTWRPMGAHRVRYKVKSRPDYFSFEAEADPKLNYYGFYFNGREFFSEHYMGLEMKCHRELPGQYRCSATENWMVPQKGTIIYRPQGKGRFDFLIYDGFAGAKKPPKLFLRIYSDGKHLYELIYKEGRIIEKDSHIYPLEKTVPVR